MQNKIKIFYIIDSIGVGGLEMVVKDLALEIDKNQFDVTVVGNRVQFMYLSHLNLISKF